MAAVVLRGDARNLPLPDASADLIVTSPPFLNLRSYTDGGTHYGGQIGAGTREQFLSDLWECTAEMARVLKPSGSIFVELGDSYADKCLNDTPARYAIGCVDKLGLLKRAEIIWHHANGLPESVTDRVRRSHSVVFHFTRQPRYYSAVDEIREEHASEVARRLAGTMQGGASRQGKYSGIGTNSGGIVTARGNKAGQSNPLGKLPGSVWEIPSAPLVVPASLGISHFAAYPPELCRRIILGWSPPGVCTACGEGRRPVVDRTNRPLQRVYNGVLTKVPGASREDCRKGVPQVTEATITGYACACPEPDAPTRPAVVLDPFAGTGTTMLVASVLGRIGVGVDRSMDYARLARWRTQDPGERCRALGVPKPPPVPDGQEALFG